MTSTSNEPRYDVLWPSSRKAVKSTAAAPRLPDLNGKVVCELWDILFRGDTIYPIVREYIRGRFPDVKFIDHKEFGNFHGARERDVIKSLPEKLKKFKADAVIVGIGA
ncbi:MAG: hypothetical protein A3G24_16680 [Betaproteobacteria bacterium RIFCSPLOWO2_12_FULL_62_13]|nr:MAG: hypothetical protein A3G24_16680 [Betaproteobacteria bacterium RIFCSPLOWO2_12_FULL_62_13]